MNPPEDTARERNRLKRATLDAKPARRPTADEMREARLALGIKTPLEHWADRKRKRTTRQTSAPVATTAPAQSRPHDVSIAKVYPALAYKPGFAG